MRDLLAPWPSTLWRYRHARHCIPCPGSRDLCADGALRPLGGQGVRRAMLDLVLGAIVAAVSPSTSSTRCSTQRSSDRPCRVVRPHGRAAPFGHYPMTLNGWFQIAFMFALVIATARPLGLYIASVLQGRPTFLDPVLRPVERRLYALAGYRREARAELARLRGRAPGLQRRRLRAALRDPAPAAPAAAEPAGLRSDEPAPGVQHGGLLRLQHQLAELRRRNHALLLQPDGRPDGAELPLRRHRLRRRRRARARLRAQRRRRSATSGSI